MNLAPRPHYTDEEKFNFYSAAAKRFKAELKLYGATAAVHLENKNDEVFWGKVLRTFYPNAKFRFIAASRNISGNNTCGCTQCLQYRAFLDQKFWIAIDSDYRYLNQQSGVDISHWILQTYTYSFENHFCYAPNADEALRIATNGWSSFDFRHFLTEYSRIIYPLLVWQLYLQGSAAEAFPQHVFHRMLTLNLGAHATQRNGEAVLQQLKDRARKLRTHLKNQYPDADYTWHEARCNDLGVHRDNAYLFVRGHQLYDLVVALGTRLRQETKQNHPELAQLVPHTFESILLSRLHYDGYTEMQKLKSDIEQLK